MLIIYSTFPNRKEADKTARVLLQKKLAVCVVCWPVNSLYWWKGKIISDKECAMFAKTTKKNEKKARGLIEETHSYSVPCVASIEIKSINAAYKKWLKNILNF